MEHPRGFVASSFLNMTNGTAISGLIHHAYGICYDSTLDVFLRNYLAFVAVALLLALSGCRYSNRKRRLSQANLKVSGIVSEEGETASNPVVANTSCCIDDGVRSNDDTLSQVTCGISSLQLCTSGNLEGARQPSSWLNGLKELGLVGGHCQEPLPNLTTTTHVCFPSPRLQFTRPWPYHTHTLYTPTTINQIVHRSNHGSNDYEEAMEWEDETGCIGTTPSASSTYQSLNYRKLFLGDTSNWKLAHRQKRKARYVRKAILLIAVLFLCYYICVTYDLISIDKYF